MKRNQYQQNEQLKSLNLTKTTTDDVGNPSPGFGQKKTNVTRVKPFNGITILSYILLAI
jgi:hypothetical protein